MAGHMAVPRHCTMAVKYCIPPVKQPYSVRGGVNQGRRGRIGFNEEFRRLRLSCAGGGKGGGGNRTV